MIKLEGTVINTFRVDGGTNKRAKNTKHVTRCNCLVRWSFQTDKSKTN